MGMETVQILHGVIHTALSKLYLANVLACVRVCVCEDRVNTLFAIEFLSEMKSRQNYLQARAAPDGCYTKSQ
jgi:hypothetical protein